MESTKSKVKIMKSFMSFVIVVLMVVSVFAQPTNPSIALKDLRKKYKDIKTLTCEFREIFEWSMTGETIVREGTLIVTSDDRMRIETPEQLVVATGEEIYRYNKYRHQVMIEAIGKGGETLLPRRFLLDFTDGFNAKEVSSLPVEGSKGFRLDLTPKSKDEAMLNSASLWVSFPDFVVHRIKIVDLNNNSTTYILKDVKFNHPVDKTATSFQIPDGSEIFDLR